jgi:glycosyltransferase involved in cell wall biosynthesis
MIGLQSHKRSFEQSVTERQSGLRTELRAALAERERAEADDATPAVKALLDRQIDLLRDTLEAHTALSRVQASSGWRMLEALRRQRVALRRITLALRGLRPRRRRRGVPTFVTTAPVGVNVAGYLNTESGMGEAARLSIRSLEAAGIPVALNNVPSRLRMLDSSFTAFVEANPHPFNLVHLNADNMEGFARLRGDGYFRNRYTIGYWFWELAEFRRDWLPAFGFVDEVWAPSEFGRSALAARSRVPVVCMPLPIVVPSASSFGRSHFNLADDAFVFLFTFDVSSQLERKNPLGIVTAFRRAFGGRRDVILALKFTNAEYDPRGVRELYRAAEGINVVLFDKYMTRDELGSLMGAADCYVSLHRSEGFGLGIAEAMAMGKPVVATRYSGPCDFMTASNSYPVNYQIVPIPKDYGPYLEGFSWAEPDIDHGSRLMKEIVENRAEAAARGRQAAADMAASRSPSHTGARIFERLTAIRTRRHGP